MILQINQLAFSFEARERDWFFGYIHDMIAINVNEKVGFQRTETRKITNTTKDNCYSTELLVKDVKKTILYVLLRQRLAKRSTIASKTKTLNLIENQKIFPKEEEKLFCARVFAFDFHVKF